MKNLILSVVLKAFIFAVCGKFFLAPMGCFCYSTLSGHFKLLLFAIFPVRNPVLIMHPSLHPQCAFQHIVVIQTAAAAAAAAWSSSWFRWHLGGGLSISHYASDSLIWNVNEPCWKVAAAPPSPPPSRKVNQARPGRNLASRLNLAAGENILLQQHLGTTALLLYVGTLWHSSQQQRHVTRAKQMQAGWLTLPMTDELHQRHFLFCTRT